MRLDKYIFEKFHLASRARAESLVKTGRVSVDGRMVNKPAFEANDGMDITIEDEDYASQGAYKLEEAFKAFGLDVEGKACADIGCSNGGFTDCMLRRGAKSVLAVDVADCALDKRLLDSGKVTFLKANARALPQLDEVDFVASDVSFISQKLILPEIFKLLKRGGEAVILIKPQFELNRAALNKQGIVLDGKLRAQAIELVTGYALTAGFEKMGLCTSPVRYDNKNEEYLLLLKKH